MNDISKSKKDWRAFLRKKREELLPSYRKQAEKQIFDILFSSEIYKEADTVLAYYPIGSELGILPIITKTLEDSKRVAFPISNQRDYSLDFRYVSDISELTIGTFSIPEPSITAEKYVFSENSLCIVPALAFDRNGHRIGYGKGFYDRFLLRFKGFSVGLIYSDFIFDTLPYESTDFPVNMIISEREELFIYEKKNK